MLEPIPWKLTTTTVQVVPRNRQRQHNLPASDVHNSVHLMFHVLVDTDIDIDMKPTVHNIWQRQPYAFPSAPLPIPSPLSPSASSSHV